MVHNIAAASGTQVDDLYFEIIKCAQEIIL